MTIEQATTASGDDTSTRRRILAATTEVLARNGQTKLSLSEVAMQAALYSGVRMTRRPAPVP